MALVKVKDPIPVEMKSGVVYEVPCSWSKVYIGKTKRILETRMKEHRAAAHLGQVEKSAVPEHAWTNEHVIDWDDVRVLDETPKSSVLLIKEALHIRLRPPEERSTETLAWRFLNAGHMLQTVNLQQRSM